MYELEFICTGSTYFCLQISSNRISINSSLMTFQILCHNKKTNWPRTNLDSHQTPHLSPWHHIHHVMNANTSQAFTKLKRSFLCNSIFYMRRWQIPAHKTPIISNQPIKLPIWQVQSKPGIITPLETKSFTKFLI